jgi:hypothetical protein
MFRDERGSMIVLAAVVLPLLLAFAAVALDTGYMYDYKQRMGAAADAAALAGAFEIKRSVGIDSATLNAYIRDDAARNGFTDGVDGITITISRPPVTGLHVGDTKYVEVVIARPTPTFFAQILGRSSVMVSARAVAGPDEGSGCVYALHTVDTKYDPEFEVPQSGTNISVPNCDIVDNGNFTLSSGSSITANHILVTANSGSVSGTIAPAGALSYGNSPSSDPFADMDQAALFGTAWVCGWTGQSWVTGVPGVKTNVSGSGSFVPSSGHNYQMNPGVYCGSGGTDAMKIGLKVNTPDPPGTCNTAVDDVVNFLPGIYIVLGGGLDWKHTCVTGTGVVFYLTGDADNLYPSCGSKVLSTDPPDRFFFSAPTATTAGFKNWLGVATSPVAYEGLLFIQDRRQSTGVAGAYPSVNCQLAGSMNPVVADMLPQNMVLDGALYFPDHHILYGATSLAAGNYTILIGGTLEFKGAATFNTNFAGLAGGSPIKRPGLGE